MADLPSILERVGKAQSGDNQLSVEICAALVGEDFYRDVSTSMTAAVALVERVLPGWTISLSNAFKDQSWECCLTSGDGRFLQSADQEIYGRHQTAPFAILAALLRALIQKDAANE